MNDKLYERYKNIVDALLDEVEFVKMQLDMCDRKGRCDLESPEYASYTNDLLITILGDDVEFCETCGKRVVVGDVCRSCNGDELVYCSECGEKLADTDIIIGKEYHEFWGAPCHEDIVVGYECGCCGNRMIV